MLHAGLSGENLLGGGNCARIVRERRRAGIELRLVFRRWTRFCFALCVVGTLEQWMELVGPCAVFYSHSSSFSCFFWWLDT